MPVSERTREPHWPRERDLERYDTLSQLDIQQLMSAGGLWIEIGIGEGARPMRPLINQTHVTLKAIDPHRKALPAGISLTTGSVPEHLGFLAENRGKARLVTDIFGALSYCDDPVQALVYGALLLGTEGVFVGFTELHRIGDLETWDRLSHFFARRMQQQISFQTVFALGDASREFSTYMRVRVEGRAKTRASLAKLLQEVRRRVGSPQRGAPIWTSTDKSARIWSVRYSQPDAVSH